MSIEEIHDSIEELTKKTYSGDEFFWEFMKAYQAPKSTIAMLGEDAGGSDINGILWKPWVHFKHAKNGKVGETLTSLTNSKKTSATKTRFIVSTDGTEFGARDMKSDIPLFCSLKELKTKCDFFLPIVGIDRFVAHEENPVDIKATKSLALLYDTIIVDNPEWKESEKQQDLNHFMSQVIFCLFAEDTGIFKENLLSETLPQISRR